MSGSRSKKSGGQYDEPKRPSLGSGMAEGAAKKMEKAKKTKQQRLDDIMSGKAD